jgi:hypothetical protein
VPDKNAESPQHGKHQGGDPGSVLKFSPNHITQPSTRLIDYGYQTPQNHNDFHLSYLTIIFHNAGSTSTSQLTT